MKLLVLFVISEIIFMGWCIISFALRGQDISVEVR